MMKAATSLLSLTDPKRFNGFISRSQMSIKLSLYLSDSFSLEP